MSTRSTPYRARATVERDLADVVDAIAEVLRRGGAPPLPAPRWYEADDDEPDDIEQRPPGRWRGRFEGRCADDPDAPTVDVTASPTRSAPSPTLSWRSLLSLVVPSGAKQRT